MQGDLSDAGVFDVEMIGFGQWQFEQDGEDHANDAAMTKNRNVLAGMLLDDFAEARFYAGAENIAALTVGHAMVLDLFEPFVRGETEFLLHAFPAKTAPVAEVNFAQSREDGLPVLAGFQG